MFYLYLYFFINIYFLFCYFFFSERCSMDHDVTKHVKSEFMTSWDGISTNPQYPIMILAATNRKDHIDKAILRYILNFIHIFSLYIYSFIMYHSI